MNNASFRPTITILSAFTGGVMSLLLLAAAPVNAQVAAASAFTYKCCEALSASGSKSCARSFHAITSHERQASSPSAARQQCGRQRSYKTADGIIALHGRQQDKASRVLASRHYEVFKCCDVFSGPDASPYACRLDYESVRGPKFALKRDSAVRDKSLAHCTQQDFMAVIKADSSVVTNAYTMPPVVDDHAALTATMTHYARAVGGYLARPQDHYDASTELWLAARYHLYGTVYDAKSKGLDRDAFAEVVDALYIRKFWLGKQYGNCGEGADVAYCLAHRAKLDTLMTCLSSNDHAFAIYLNDETQEICALDRWDIGHGHHFCGVSFEGGTLVQAGKPSNHPWYQNLRCRDPLKISPVQYSGYGDFNATTWL